MIPRFPNHNNIDCYKVFLGKACRIGQFGEALASLIIAEPGSSATPTFLGGECFKTREEAENLSKYIRTKFARCLLGVLKVTQHVSPDTWAYVPLQDFTASGDIDWGKDVPNINRQLCGKYGLSVEEMDFIESRVKEMK